MAKLPWFPYFPSDWSRDTRCLSLAARGAWIDILGVLWNSKSRGKKSLPLEGWAGELGKSVEIVEPVLMELKQFDVARVIICNGLITIMSRRQVREEKAREHTRLRVKKYRDSHCNAISNVPVTAQKSEVIVRSQNQKSEKKERKSETHPIPENWSLSDEMKTYGLKKGMVPLTIDHEFEHCKTRHAESRFTARGWTSQVWTTWVLNWVSFGSKQVTPQSAPPPQAKCAFSNEPCEAYAVPGSKYCAVHRETIRKAQGARA